MRKFSTVFMAFFFIVFSAGALSCCKTETRVVEVRTSPDEAVTYQNAGVGEYHWVELAFKILLH